MHCVGIQLIWFLIVHYAILGRVEFDDIRAAVLQDTWSSQMKQARIVSAVSGSTSERSAWSPKGCRRWIGALREFWIRIKVLSSLNPRNEERTRSESEPGEITVW
jgi:hypothetical protein